MRLRHEPPLLLLLGPVPKQRERVQSDVDRDQRPERRLAPLDLLAGERLGDEVEPGAAVFHRDHDPEDPELRHAGDQVEIEAMVDIVLDRDREDAVIDERAYCVLKQPLLGCEVELHLSSLDDRWASFPHASLVLGLALALLTAARSTGRGSPSIRSPRSCRP